MGYELQDRGSTEAYAHYFSGMDRSMQQKVALVTSYFPVKGAVADMGCGSGRGSFDLACLYPGLKVVGIDINPKAIAYASSEYKRPNLSFAVGDIAAPDFAAASFDAILNSSVLHHVTSFNNFSRSKLCNLLDAQARLLKPGGVLGIRDFVAPAENIEVILEIPADDGRENGRPEELSTAALFKLFLSQFRCFDFPQGGIPCREQKGAERGWRRFKTSNRLAAEFLLRKDYRESWELEILEEYTYFSQAEFETELAQRGLRLVLSRPLWNPWIVKNRFDGKFRWYAEDGETLPHPPTNYVIIAERTSGGVTLRETEVKRAVKPFFLKISHYDHPAHKWDLVNRPNRTLDLLPWYLDGDEVWVVSRQNYPRPILNASSRQPPLDMSSASGFITEPLSAIVEECRPERELVARLLSERAGISGDAIFAIEGGLELLPSPGGILEIVSGRAIHIAPPQEELHGSYETGFATPGTVRAGNAAQLLRAFQVGSMFDARLEAHIYDLLLNLKKSPGVWIGAPLPHIRRVPLELESVSTALRSKTLNTPFSKTATGAGFLEACRGKFEEVDGKGATLVARELEYVIPSTLGTNSVLCAPLALCGETLCIGVEKRELPAAQVGYGNAEILTLPAWRLPKDKISVSAAEEFLQAVMKTEFGLTLGEISQLGGAWYPSIGVSPEIMWPFVAEALDSGTAGSLLWFDIKEIIRNRRLLRDGHLLISSFRIAHAFYENRFG